jgi:hypothetical protein
MSANPTPEGRRAAPRGCARAGVELLRRERRRDRLFLLSCVVAPSEQTLRRSQRAHLRVEVEPAT